MFYLDEFSIFPIYLLFQTCLIFLSFSIPGLVLPTTLIISTKKFKKSIQLKLVVKISKILTFMYYDDNIIFGERLLTILLDSFEGPVGDTETDERLIFFETLNSKTSTSFCPKMHTTHFFFWE